MKPDLVGPETWSSFGSRSLHITVTNGKCEKIRKSILLFMEPLLYFQNPKCLIYLFIASRSLSTGDQDNSTENLYFKALIDSKSDCTNLAEKEPGLASPLLRVDVSRDREPKNKIFNKLSIITLNVFLALGF
jgi:hypothetical protein